MLSLSYTAIISSITEDEALPHVWLYLRLVSRGFQEIVEEIFREVHIKKAAIKFVNSLYLSGFAARPSTRPTQWQRSGIDFREHNLVLEKVTGEAGSFMVVFKYDGSLLRRDRFNEDDYIGGNDTTDWKPYVTQLDLMPRADGQPAIVQIANLVIPFCGVHKLAVEGAIYSRGEKRLAVPFRQFLSTVFTQQQHGYQPSTREEKYWLRREITGYHSVFQYKYVWGNGGRRTGDGAEMLLHEEIVEQFRNSGKANGRKAAASDLAPAKRKVGEEEEAETGERGKKRTRK